MRFYGYARVSTAEQNLGRQWDALVKYGIPEENIFFDKLSGRDFFRPAYQRVKSLLSEGDILVVKSLDRLGRCYHEVIAEWREIVVGRKADIIILEMPLLNTTRDKGLIGTLISDVVLGLLSYVAETERDSIRQRQAEGIALAKQQGKRLGRKPLPLPEEFYTVYERWLTRELTLKTAGALLGVSSGQFRTMVKKFRRLEGEKCQEKQPA